MQKFVWNLERTTPRNTSYTEHMPHKGKGHQLRTFESKRNDFPSALYMEK